MIIPCDVHEKYSDPEMQTFCNITVLLQLHDINGGKLATNRVCKSMYFCYSALYGMYVLQYHKFLGDQMHYAGNCYGAISWFIQF